MSRFFRFFIALIACLSTAWAWASATPAEAQAQATAAVAHIKKVGVEQAIRDFNSAPEWKVKAINVNLIDMKGLCLASSLNERLVGKNTYESKDPSGKEFVKEFIATVQKDKGEGWVDYQFINPTSKKLEPRSMFVRKVPGFEGFVAIAISK